MITKRNKLSMLGLLVACALTVACGDTAEENQLNVPTAGESNLNGFSNLDYANASPQAITNAATAAANVNPALKSDIGSLVGLASKDGFGSSADISSLVGLAQKIQGSSGVSAPSANGFDFSSLLSSFGGASAGLPSLGSSASSLPSFSSTGLASSLPGLIGTGMSANDNANISNIVNAANMIDANGASPSLINSIVNSGQALQGSSGFTNWTGFIPGF